MAAGVRNGWRRRLGLEGWLAPLAAGIFVFGLGEELWSRYLPEYLRFLGASALTVGAFGTLRDLIDAAYAYPGGWLSDRLGNRRALLLFGLFTTAGFVLYLSSGSIAGVFVGVFLVMAWKSLGLPATFALVGEELSGSRRIVGFTVQSILKRLPIVIAPPLGGLLIERLGVARGMRTGFIVSIAVSVAMLAGLWTAFRKRSLPLPETGTPQGSSTRLHPTLKRLLIADCLIRLCEGLPDVFLVVWAIEILRVSPSQFGLATSVMMGTAILSYFPAAALAERVEKKPFVIATFLFFTLFPLAVVLSSTFSHLLGAYVIGGLREVGEPARKALIVDLSTLGARGKTVGLYYAIRGFTVAGAAAIGGALWTIRPALTFFAAAVLGVAGTLWAAVTLPKQPLPSTQVTVTAS
ncbi:MAG TPA: MFS transporter [Thermoanaerobaculia bacterium]|nr:MFS transporter [Thermoanaerobaculia bacterium]